jgi:hypothetical protein
MAKRSAFGWVVTLFLAACAHESAKPTAAVPPPGPNAAHDLTYEAIACWLGPVWGDAISEPVEQRKENADARCLGTVRAVWANNDDKTNVERLRALESTAMQDLVAKVDELGKNTMAEKDRHDLVTLLKHVVGAQRDNMWARRAGDRIRIDESRQKPHQRITDDERKAMDPLLKSESLRSLLTLDAGRYTADAHALGILSAMDRINVATGLPRHVEIFAAEPTFTLLFHTSAPEVPPDPSAPLGPRYWIDYLDKAAANAGHPVPSTAAGGADRVLLGWAGMLDGIADQLAEKRAQLSDHLKPVVEGTIRRLQAEAIGDRNRYADQQTRRSSAREDLSGSKERGMANCPSAVPGATTRAVVLDDGVAVEVTASDSAQITAIRDRAHRQAAVAHHPQGLPPHLGIGSDTGEIGYCPVVLIDTEVKAEDLPKGARITVRPKDKVNVPAVQKLTEERISALRRTGP